MYIYIYISVCRNICDIFYIKSKIFIRVFRSIRQQFVSKTNFIIWDALFELYLYYSKYIYMNIKISFYFTLCDDIQKNDTIFKAFSIIYKKDYLNKSWFISNKLQVVIVKILKKYFFPDVKN